VQDAGYGKRRNKTSILIPWFRGLSPDEDK
jgi:hypothetical protein